MESCRLIIFFNKVHLCNHAVQELNYVNYYHLNHSKYCVCYWTLHTRPTKQLKIQHNSDDLPILFSLAIESIDRWYALRTSSSETTNLIRFHLSGWSSHWWAFTATWVPSGLVRTKTSPTTALSGLKKLFSSTMEF
jgi:hypothetical protein